MNIERNDERILIKYIDSNFNTYKCIITTDDVFVANFCKGNLEKIEKILKKNTIVEMDDYYLFKVEEPIFLEYQLKKEKQEEITNLGLILEKFKILEDENKMLRDKVEKLEDFQGRMCNSVYIKDCNIIVPKNVSNLNLNLCRMRSNPYEHELEFFKLQNLEYLTELKKINLGFHYDVHYSEINEDYLKINFNILNSLKKLELIEISMLINDYCNKDFTKNKLDEKIGSELENVISITYEKKEGYANCIITRKID